MKSLLNTNRFIYYFCLVLSPSVNALEFNPADFSDYHIDLMNNGSIYTLYSENYGDRLYITNPKGKQILAAKNLTIDGYSAFDKIVGMPNLAKGFSIINRGSSWGGEFRYDIKWENNQFMLVDAFANSGHKKDDYLYSNVQCHKKLNIPFNQNTDSSLVDILRATEDKDFSLYCQETLTPIYSVKELESIAHGGNTELISFDPEILQQYLNAYPITKQNVALYNNIAFYLYQKDHTNNVAMRLLWHIIEAFPFRDVAYLNLADIYQAKGQCEQAKHNYQEYVNLRTQKHQSIPKRVSQFIASNQCTAGTLNKIKLDCAKALTEMEINHCDGTKLNTAILQMHRYLTKSLQHNADDLEVIKGIKNSQNQWEKYLTAHCYTVYNYWRDGTVSNTMEVSCKTQLTQQRTHDIWQSFLTFVDHSKPILPEPAQ